MIEILYNCHRIICKARHICIFAIQTIRGVISKCHANFKNKSLTDKKPNEYCYIAGISHWVPKQKYFVYTLLYVTTSHKRK